MTGEESLYLDEIEKLLASSLPAMRSAQCPPLARFIPAAWNPEDLPHVRDCPHCQRATASVWRVTCPSPAETVRFALDPQSSPLAAAWQVHLRRDLCPRCRPLVKWAAKLGTLGSAAAAFFELPPWTPAIAEASSARPPFSAAEVLPGGWRLSLRETTQGLIARVSTDAPGAPRHLRLRIAGADAVLEAVILLQPEAQGLAGESPPFAEWSTVLGTGCTVLLEPVE